MTMIATDMFFERLCDREFGDFLKVPVSFSRFHCCGCHGIPCGCHD